MSEIEIRVRDADLNIIGVCDDWASFVTHLKFQDVSTWELKLDAATPLYEQICTPGAGIEVWREADDGNVSRLLSGPRTKRKLSVTGSSEKLVVTGVSDTVWLRRRLARPEPFTAAPPYSSSAYYTATGVVSTVLCNLVAANLGATALSFRRVGNLITIDPAVGPSVTVNARWQNLLELVKSTAIAAGDLGFTVVQGDAGLEFRVLQSVDRSATAMFSRELGNLEGFEFSDEAPSGNYAVVAGQGEGTARTVVEGGDAVSLASWGLCETFRDRRDTASGTELAQTISEELAKSADKTALELEPIETDALRFGVDYNLGDIITVVVDDSVSIVDKVRQVKAEWSPKGEQITPLIGNADSQFVDVPDLFQRQRQTLNRVQDLERR